MRLLAESARPGITPPNSTRLTAASVAGIDTGSSEQPTVKTQSRQRCFLNHAVEKRRRAADLHLQLAGAARKSQQAQQLRANIRTADRHLEVLRTARGERLEDAGLGPISAWPTRSSRTVPAPAMVCRRLCRSLAAGRNSDTRKLIDARNSGAKPIPNLFQCNLSRAKMPDFSQDKPGSYTERAGPL